MCLGCFIINTYKGATKIGVKVALRFKIAQSSRDKALLESFISYLGCGVCVSEEAVGANRFIVSKFSDIFDKVIPFFNKYPILGVKALDFSSWSEAAHIINKGEHLTDQGLKTIWNIKSKMNKERSIKLLIFVSSSLAVDEACTQFRKIRNKSSIEFKQSSHMQIFTIALKLYPKTKKFSSLKISSGNLVIWGSNLALTLGGRLSKTQSNITKIPPFIRSVIVGLILSDGWMQLPSDSKNARLCFKQSTKNSSYVWFVFFILSHYCSSFPHITSGIRKGKPFSGLAFQTRQLPCITDIYNLFK